MASANNTPAAVLEEEVYVLDQGSVFGTRASSRARPKPNLQADIELMKLGLLGIPPPTPRPLSHSIRANLLFY